jgi:hypothetical protein
MGVSRNDTATPQVNSETALPKGSPLKEAIMRIEIKYLATPLVSGAVAVAIVAAPSVAIAGATPPVTCGTASASECATPGNVQLDVAPPVQSVKQYPYPDGFGIYHHAIGQ